MTAYDSYLAGELDDYAHSDDLIAEAMKNVPEIVSV